MTLISPVQQWAAERTGLKEKLSLQTLMAWQLDKVRKAVEYARNNCDYYCKKLKGIDISGIKTLRDMQDIPFTYPEDINEDPKAFVCVPTREISGLPHFPLLAAREAPKGYILVKMTWSGQ